MGEDGDGDGGDLCGGSDALSHCVPYVLHVSNELHVHGDHDGPPVLNTHKSYNNYIGYTAVQKELKCPQSDGRVGFRNVLIWGEQSSKGESLISHIVCWVVYFRVLSYDRCRRRGSVCVYIRARVHAKTQRCTAKRRY